MQARSFKITQEQFKRKKRLWLQTQAANVLLVWFS